MSESIDPGPGYRLLSDDEIVRDGDERQDRADREPRPWLRVVCGVGRTVASYRGEFREIGILAVRRRVDSEPSELGPLREQVDHWKVKAKCYGDIVHGCSPVLASAGFPVDASERDGSVGGIRRAVEALTAERDDLRQKLDDTTERLDERSEKVRLMTDYYISLQRAIKAHCRGQQVEIGPCQYHADLLNADLAMTPERACEIVNQLRQANQLEVRSNTEEWFKPLGPENWQCRPAKPRPVKLTVTCPPSQREAVEAAIRAAGGDV